MLGHGEYHLAVGCGYEVYSQMSKHTEELWDSIAEENGCFELTDAQKQELDRRVQSLQKNPQAGRSWEDIKSEFLKSK